METPVRLAVFLKEVAAPPERWMDQTYNVAADGNAAGGHFVIFERDTVICDTLTKAFTPRLLAATRR
jgi:hypothetical protein